MTQDQINFLYKHKVMYSNFKAVGVIAHVSNEDGENFLAIAKQFDPNYPNVNLWCPECMMNLVDFVYTQANKKQAFAEPINIPDGQSQEVKAD